MHLAGLAGTASWAFTFPVDVVKTRFQGECRRTGRYASYADCVRQTFAEGGWRAFFARIQPALVRAFLVNSVTFFVVTGIFRVYAWRFADPSSDDDEAFAVSHYSPFEDRWQLHLRPLGEAGTTFIDPVVHGTLL